MKKEALTQGVPVMNESRIREMVESLDMATYRLSAFADTIHDILDNMPTKEEDDNFPFLCGIFCAHEQNKLDVLMSQMSKDIQESMTVISELTKEVWRNE